MPDGWEVLGDSVARAGLWFAPSEEQRSRAPNVAPRFQMSGADHPHREGAKYAKESVTPTGLCVSRAFAVGTVGF